MLFLGFSAAALAVTVGCAGDWKGSVGAVFAKDNRNGRVYVREAPSDMSAARAGLLVDDEIVAIDGKPAREMTPAQIHGALFGKVGTKVTLQIVREGVTRVIVVERGPSKGPSPEGLAP